MLDASKIIKDFQVETSPLRRFCKNHHKGLRFNCGQTQQKESLLKVRFSLGELKTGEFL